MDQDNLDAILSWPTPRTTSEVRSFHGLVQYSGKFIKKFRGICAHILHIIKSGMKTRFIWNSQYNQGFETLNKKIVELPTLVLPSFDKLFQVECDARNVGIGVLPIQEGRPVAFHSEKLNDAKNKYSSYQLELYALV